MILAKVYKGNTLIADEVELANSFMTRFLGLMFRKSMDQNHGLLLVQCNSIHTFFMRFSIDAIFLSSEGEILKIDHSLRPSKISKPIKGAIMVLELNSQKASLHNLQIGDILIINKTE